MNGHGRLHPKTPCRHGIDPCGLITRDGAASSRPTAPASGDPMRARRRQTRYLLRGCEKCGLIPPCRGPSHARAGAMRIRIFPCAGIAIPENLASFTRRSPYSRPRNQDTQGTMPAPGKAELWRPVHVAPTLRQRRKQACTPGCRGTLRTAHQRRAQDYPVRVMSHFQHKPFCLHFFDTIHQKSR